MNKVKSYMLVIVGRPNVGKSSLFNRIVGSRKAIVDASRGTTRDRLYARMEWKGKSFNIVDTGGFDTRKVDDMAGLVLKQLESAIHEADLIFFVTDGITGLLPQDMEFSALLRRTSKKVYLVVNKADDESKKMTAVEFYGLGLGEPYAVSAKHGTGIKRLMDDASGHVREYAPAKGREAIKVAIVGRPNVGKSSYLNCILKEERAIVHSVAGTTRDAIDTEYSFNGREYILIDTAGMRHNTKLKEAADFFSGVRSREAVKRSDVSIVLIDGYDGLREDDARIIDFVISEGKGLIIAVNKWDLAKEVGVQKYRDMLVNKLKAIRDYPVTFISSKTGQNVDSSLDMAGSVYERSKAMIPPERLRDILGNLNKSTEVMGKGVKLVYLVQKGTMPPVFNIGLKSSRTVNNNMKKYIENTLRASCDFEGVAVRVDFINMHKGKSC